MKKKTTQFKPPLWALQANFLMWRKMRLGEMGPEREKAGRLYPPDDACGIGACLGLATLEGGA